MPSWNFAWWFFSPAVSVKPRETWIWCLFLEVWNPGSRTWIIILKHLIFFCCMRLSFPQFSKLCSSFNAYWCLLNLLMWWFWCALVKYSAKHNSVNFLALWDNQSLLNVAWHGLWLHLRNVASHDHPVNLKLSSFLPALQTHPQKERAPKAAATFSSSSTGSWWVRACSSVKKSWYPSTWGIVVWRWEVRFCSAAEFWFPQNLGFSEVLLPCCVGSPHLSLETCSGGPGVLLLCEPADFG